jgi:hypothetical protein
MTSPLSAVAARVRRYPSDVDLAATRSSRNATHVSHERDNWPQIRSHVAECEVARAMIGAMPEPPERLTDWPSDLTGYTWANPASYTVVYMTAKEVW